MKFSSELLARDDAFDNRLHVLVQQRLAAGDRDDRRAAFVDRLQAVLDRQAAIEDIVLVIDLAAAGAGQIAAEQRLQHQHQRIALDAFQTLADDVAAHPGLLYQGNAHRDLSFQTDNLVATQGRGKNRRHQWRA